MNFVEKNRSLFAPPYCDSVETFLCPIPNSRYEAPNGLRIGEGWRYFNQLRVIQRKNNSYMEAIMSPSKIVRIAKMNSKKNLIKTEKQINNIIKKRQSLSKLNMSQPHIMGVINLTPDSFYKKSQKEDPCLILKTCTRMISDGASIIDFGGESTRPGSKKISVGEEKNRVAQSIIDFKKFNFNALISLDTRNLSTMKIGFKNGVDIFNDISGLNDNEKIKFISKTKIPVIVMHMQNKPENMQIKPQYTFAPLDIYNILSKKIKNLLKMGIDESKIVVDPGIGFGKNKHHNIDILKNLSLFHGLGVPVLIGVSRKSLIGELTIEDCKTREINKKLINPSKRLSGSIAFAIHGYNNGVQFTRTHDVFETKQAFVCQSALN